ncbi:MAG: hypothetical protein AVDCRST_MAG59-5056, partial [uncultured Thermomicrobiales bacterium]
DRQASLPCRGWRGWRWDDRGTSDDGGSERRRTVHRDAGRQLRPGRGDDQPWRRRGQRHPTAAAARWGQSCPHPRPRRGHGPARRGDHHHGRGGGRRARRGRRRHRPAANVPPDREPRLARRRVALGGPGRGALLPRGWPTGESALVPL